jgi:Flp pilus assembly protein TadD
LVKKIVIAVLIAIAIGTSLWFARPLYKNWKQNRFLIQAQNAWAKADYTNAIFSARKVLEINPANIGACRLMAQLAEQAKSPQAITWRARVADLAPETTNRLELARTALLFGNIPQAERALRSINPTNCNTVDFHTLSAMLALAQNNFSAAEEHCAKAAELDPKNKFARFNLAVLRSQSTNTATSDAAIQTLEELCSDPGHRRDSLRNLASAFARRKDFANAQKYSKQLLDEAPVPFDDRLIHLTILQESRSPEISAYLASLETFAAPDANNLNSLGSWLRAHRMSDEALNWLIHLPQNVRTKSSTSELIVECYFDRADWAGAQAILENEKWNDLDFVRLALLARTQRELNQKFSAQSNWRAAMNAASGRVKALYALLEMADSWRWESERTDAAWRILEQFPSERQLLAMLERTYTVSGDTHGLQKVYATMMKYSTPDAVAKNNFAAVSLLLKLQTGEAFEIARDNFARHPHDEVITSTYAYALHLQGRTQDGLNLLEKLTAQQLRKPEVATYYGVLLAAAGQTNKAAEFLKIGSQSKRLLPEEKALISNALAASRSDK